MSRLFSAVLSTLPLLIAAPNLRLQNSQEVLLAARRTGAVELIDPATLNTIARLNFDFHVESVAGSADGAAIYVEAMAGRVCCHRYVLDLNTLTLTKSESNSGNSGNSLVSPYGRWRAETISFRGPVLKLTNLSSGASQKMTPADLPLTEDECGGNWAAEGAWFGDHFYFYVECPRHPGFLWTVIPGSVQLGARTAVASFGEIADCQSALPVAKILLVAASSLFIYEPFSSTADRTGMCQEPLPGGVWKIDPATGQLTQHIGAQFHFNSITPDLTGSIVYGVDPGDSSWSGPVQIVALDIQNDLVLNSRSFDAGVLQIAVAQLRKVPIGDIQIGPPSAGR